MSTHKEQSKAAHSYAIAYANHYSERDYASAIRSYGRLVAQHPGTPEAEYSRTQIHNIVKSVVPAEELLAAQLKLVLGYLSLEANAPVTASP